MYAGRFTLVILSVLLCMLCSGCGESSCAVGGKVLIDGEALSEGRIALRPTIKTEGTRSVQAVITDGDYSFTKDQGIVSGSYSVVITGRRKTGRSLPPEEGSGEVTERYEQYLPPKYNTKTELTAEIVGNSDDLNFELELPKRKRRRR